MSKDSGKQVLGGGAISVFCLLLVALLFSAFFATDVVPPQLWKPQISNWRVGHHDEINANEEPQEVLLRRLVRGDDRIELETTGFSCRSELHTEVCVAHKPLRIANNGLKIYIPGSGTAVKRMIQPYARKEDQTAMERVTSVEIQHGNTTDLPPCHFTHDVPAVIFSSGGFTGNQFHEINEVIIPLFLTSRHFRSRVQFVVTDFKPSIISKYKKILTHLSSYEVMNPAADDGRVHCFPGGVIGLVYHDNVAINSTEIPGGYTMSDFRHFLRQSYNLKMTSISEIEKPTLVFLSRRKTRRFVNEDEILRMIEGLGFKVVVATRSMISNFDSFVELLNSCSTLVGAHGAGLTNEVFLPEGAVVVQVVPLGLEWAAAAYYGDPPTNMGLRYLAYKIRPEESTLLDKYGWDHPVIADPQSLILQQGYRAARAVYVDGQDLKVNVGRFRETLVRAMELVGQRNHT